MEPQRHVMLDINFDSYNAVVWVTSQFSGPFNKWWLNCKLKGTIIDTFDSLVTELRKTSLLTNIRDDAISSLIQLTQGSLSNANYTQQLNDFLRRSRQHLTDDFMCANSINGLAIISFGLKPSLVVPNKRGTTCRSWSCKIF
jgi:hypothetical protein